MAKKPVRKQAPPKPGERPRGSEADVAVADLAVEDERSIEDLVADLGGGEEPPPSSPPPKRKSKRRGKQAEAELEAEVEADPEARPAETEQDEAAPPEAAPLEEADGESPEAPEVSAEAEEDPRAVKLVDTLPIDIEDDLSEVEGEASPRLVSIVESLLFASSKPLRVKQIRKVLEEPSVRQIQLALKHLIATNDSRGIVVAQVAGGFVLQTHAQNAAWVQRLLQAKPLRLSRPQLETLAVIAYRQPVTRPEIDHIRGVDSGAVIKLLLERELIQIVGKKDEPGRPMVYGTTIGFLEFFNLMSLRDLPDLREFRELSDDTKATLRKRMADAEVEALGQEVLQFAREDGGEAAAQDAEPGAEESSESVEGEVVDEEPVTETNADEPSEESGADEPAAAVDAESEQAPEADDEDANEEDAEADDEDANEGDAKGDEEAGDAEADDDEEADDEESDDDEEADDEEADDEEADDEEADDEEADDEEADDEEADDEEADEKEADEKAEEPDDA